MNIEQKISSFLLAKSFGVAGASANRHKYGNKVLRCYLQNKRLAVPINPQARVVEGLSCVKSIQDLSKETTSISIITPPQISEAIVAECVASGFVKNIWLQPGAESARAISIANEHGLNVIADGSCILVVLGFRDY